MNILPCPFCGCAPETDDGETGGTVECCNRDCPVSPSVFRDHEPSYDGMSLAVDAWNARGGNNAVAQPAGDEYRARVAELEAEIARQVGAIAQLQRFKWNDQQMQSVEAERDRLAAELAAIEDAIPDEGDEDNATVVRKAFAAIARLSAEVDALKGRKVTLPKKTPPPVGLWMEGRNCGIDQCATAIRAARVEVEA